MTVLSRPWTGARLFAVAAAGAVAILFIAANAHFITLAFTSKPDCVLHPRSEGSAIFGAAQPSC